MKSLKVLLLVVGLSTSIAASESTSESMFNQCLNSTSVALSSLVSYIVTKSSDLGVAVLDQASKCVSGTATIAQNSCDTSIKFFEENQNAVVGTALFVTSIVATFALMKYKKDGYLFYTSEAASKE